MDKDLLGITVWELWQNYLSIYKCGEFIGIINADDIGKAVDENYEVRDVFPIEIIMSILEGKVFNFGD